MSPTEKEVLDNLSQEANKKQKEERALPSNGHDADLTQDKSTATEEENQKANQEDKEEEKTVNAETSVESKPNEPEKSMEKEENSTNLSIKKEEENKDKKQKEEEAEEEKPMTLLDHLKELRNRLTRVVILILVGFFACYAISQPVYAWLAAPLKANLPLGSSLIYTSPQGAFFVYLKVSFVLSFFLSSPYIFYQAWAFIAPGLYKEEKNVLIPLAGTSALFFFAGASFCYYVVFPVAFNFFMGFATDAIVPMISIESYLSFVLKLLIAFGLVFEMPLFAYFLGRMKLLTPERMRKWRKYAILIIFVCAAILTPPDVFSQTLMALPMLVLYELSIFIAGYANKLGRTPQEKESEPEATEKN